jgi:hypothetical protein
MQRRTLLVSLCVPCLAACANRPPKPPLKPNALQRFGMLPLKEWPDSSAAQFNRAINPPQSAGVVVVPLTPSLLGMAIGQSLRNARITEHVALTEALAAVGFEPEPTLRQAIESELARRELQVEPLSDPALAQRIRQDDFRDLPTEVDAIIDVQIHSAGYYDIGRGRGFTPYFQISARLVDTVNPGAMVEEFGYGGDYSEAKGDLRHFTTPATLTQTSLGGFQAHAQIIRAGFADLFRRVAEKLVDDFARVRDRLPRID